MKNPRLSLGRNSAGLVLGLALIVPGCGDDPAAPHNVAPEVRTAITVSSDRLDYGTVCVNEVKTMTFKIYAPASNTAPASGTVSTNSGEYSITSGGGDYALDPGDSLQVSVKFAPGSPGTFLSSLTTGGPSISLSGTGSSWVFLALTAASGGAASRSTNYPEFESAGLSTPGGVSYSDPSWNGCSSAWIIDGNPVAESKFEINNIKVPAGVENLLVTLKMDASNSCAQLLIEINGAETVKSSLSTSCGTRSYRIKWPSQSAGTYTIGIGTDQQSISCFADIAIDDVKLTFEGYCVP